jgi:hypothetical protein
LPSRSKPRLSTVIVWPSGEEAVPMWKPDVWAGGGEADASRARTALIGGVATGPPMDPWPEALVWAEAELTATTVTMEARMRKSFMRRSLGRFGYRKWKRGWINREARPAGFEPTTGGLESRGFTRELNFCCQMVDR